LGKPYGIKLRCYWEDVEKCIWEHDENTSIWEQGKKNKKSLPLFQKQKTGPFMSAC